MALGSAVAELYRTSVTSASSLHDVNRKSVVIFLSSNSSDISIQRNHLIEKCFPQLRRTLQEKGLELQIVDMNWGGIDDNSGSHQIVDLALSEIRRAKSESHGTFFISFLTSNYGYRPVPHVFLPSVFELACEALSPLTSFALRRLYELDENASPPVFVLRPQGSLPSQSFLAQHISTNYLDLSNASPRQSFESLASIIYDQFETLAGLPACSHCLSFDDCVLLVQKEIARRYSALPEPVAEALSHSMTHQECDAAFLSDAASSHRCLCILRRQPLAVVDSNSDLVECLRDVTMHAQLSRHLSRRPQEDDNERQAQLVSAVLSALPPDNVLIEDAPLDSNMDHLEHLSRLSEFVTASVSRSVEESLVRQDELDNLDLVAELLHHSRFAHEKLSCFVGREEELRRIQTYIESGSGLFTVTGPSGAGKTAFIAKAFVTAMRSADQDTVGVLRFLGTSAKSGQGLSLLRWVLLQLSDNAQPPEAWEELKRAFLDTIEAEGRSRLVLCFDSLDQLDNANGERSLLEWIPPVIPPHMRFIVSCIPGDVFDGYSVLSGRPDFTDNHIALRDLSHNEMTAAVAELLRGRRLTEPQRQTLDTAVSSCPLALYMRIATGIASTLRSSDDIFSWCRHRFDIPSFPSDVRDLIRSEVREMALQSGRVMVYRLLRYVTLANVGLSLSELEDVLSLDDDVLDEIFEWWAPPLLRVPSALLSRALSRVRPFLVVRDGTGGVGFLRWYHRHHLETVQELIHHRFEAVPLMHCGRALALCIEDAVNPIEAAHSVLAGYFGGRYSSGKPYNGRRPALAFSNRPDRLIPPMPWNFSDVHWIFGCDSRALDKLRPNVRRAYEQIFHLVRSGPAGRADALKELLGMEAFFCSAHCRIVTSELVRSLWHLVSAEDRNDVSELASNMFLFASTRSDMEDVPGLCAHLAAKAEWFPELADAGTSYLRTAMTAPNPHGLYRCAQYLGGVVRTVAERLVLRGHQDHVESALRIGNVILSASKDCSVRVWDATSGECLRVIRSQEQVWALCVVNGNVWVGFHGAMRVLDTTRWVYVRELQGHTGLVTGIVTNGRYVASSGFSDTKVRIWDPATERNVASLSGHTGAVRNVALYDNDVCSASFDRTARLWRNIEGRWQHIATMMGHTSNIRGISMDQNFIATSGDDKTVRLWNRENGSAIKVIEEFFGVVPNVCLYEGLLFCAGGSADSRVHVIDPVSFVRVRLLVGHYVPIEHVSVHNGEIYSTGHDMTVRVWPFHRQEYVNADGSVRPMIDGDNEGHFAQVFYIQIRGDDMLTSSEDRTVRLWRLSDSVCVAILRGHNSLVWCADFDDDIIVSGCADCCVRFFRRTTFEQIGMATHQGTVWNVAVASSYIAATDVNEIVIYDKSSLSPLRRLTGLSDPITSLCVRRQGRVLWGQGVALRSWDPMTGEELFSDPSHYFDHGRWRIAFISDDHVACILENDRSIETFFISSGERTPAMSGHTDRMYKIDAEEELLVTASQDRKTRLWEWSRAECISTLTHSPYWNTFARIKNGILYLASQDGSVKVFVK